MEILEMNGRATAPGEAGWIVVTCLTNWAMPLLRYDTGDLAQAVKGHCPCGRTLASFGEIRGRYSRIAFLPEGTLGLVGVLRHAIETMPHDLVRDLRQFQIHQLRDNRFELRVVAHAELPAEFEPYLRKCWSKASAQPEPVQTLRRVT